MADPTIEKVKTLFQEIKDHIFENMNDDNVPLLSSIAKATEGFAEHDFHSMESTRSALSLINKYFSGQDKSWSRQEIYGTFSDRLLVDNVDQLTENYNRILGNIRKLFPEFNLVHESHNPIFGSEATVSCSLRRCSDEEVARSMTEGEVFRDEITEEIVQDEIEYMHEFYETEYVDTTFVKARQQKQRGFSLFPTGLKSMFNYSAYTGNGFTGINDLFRSNKASDISVDDMVTKFNRFGQTLMFPFFAKEDFTIYRGDGMSISSQTFTTKGLYSGSLSVVEIAKFVANGQRMIKINLPRGTPFLPFVIQRTDEGEIALLPGTVLEKMSGMDFQTGHFAEYTVIKNPPTLSELEEATIVKHAIPPLFSDIRTLGSRRFKKWADDLPPIEGDPSHHEKSQFVLNLVNSKFGGDW